jgi:hypothetical protein
MIAGFITGINYLRLMKKSTLTLTALAALLTLSLLPSCKKDDDNGSQSRSQTLVGTWKSAQDGEDDNNNGVWDASERSNVDSTDMTTFTFNSNGTGVVTPLAFPIPISFNWNLQNNDNDLRIISSFGGSAPDTEVVNIVSLTSSEGVFKDASSKPVSFFSLKK